MTPILTDIEYDGHAQRQVLQTDPVIPGSGPLPVNEVRDVIVRGEETMAGWQDEKKWDMRRQYAALLDNITDEQASRIREMGGIPRLERGWAPVNAESNDLYQFRMASVYLAEFPKRRGTFLLYYRKPKDAGGMRIFGVSRALETLQNFQFDPGFLLRLLEERKVTEQLYHELLKLKKLDITVRAVRDGEFVGPSTPIMIVEGPLWQVQLVETTVLQCLDYASGVATRANAICAIAEKPLIDFGARRAPGEEAAVVSALASVTNGAVGAANTIAPEVARRYGLEGIQTIGTTAHAFTESYFQLDARGNLEGDLAESELQAYRAYIKYFPANPVVLIDTITKDVGLGTAKQIYEELGCKKIGVRDDSDISGKSIVYVYDRLTELGVEDFFIVISDNLTPKRIAEIRKDIEGLRGSEFYQQLDLRLGVGTYLARPEPAGMIFKLAEWEEDGMKHSVSKASGTIEKASFPVVHTYRNDLTLTDINMLPDEPAIPGLRLLQQEIDFTRSDLRNLHICDISDIPREYFMGERIIAVRFSSAAEEVRARIQRALQETVPHS